MSATVNQVAVMDPSFTGLSGFTDQTRKLERAAQALAPREHEIFLSFCVFVISCFRDKILFPKMRWFHN